MSDKKIEIVLHVDEDLDSDQVQSMRSKMSEYPGIFDTNVPEGRNHLFRVSYDPQETSSAQVLAYVQSQNLHAARIG